MTVFNRLRDYPHVLEVAYQFTERIFQAMYPLFKRLGYERADKLLRVPEKIGKCAVFNCQMCGQCALHFTGMTCPMGCPKNLRNGPCGRVRVGGFCEVNASMKCVWVDAFERSQKMSFYGDDFFMILPPLNQQNMGKSAFINIAFEKNAEMPEAWKMETGLRHEHK